MFWLAFYKFCRDALQLRSVANPDPAFRVGAKSGWWWPMRGVVVLSDRPSVLSLDDEGRLHSEDGPATKYSDGFSVWSIGGVRVNEQIVMRPSEQTIEEMTGEENAEIKRIRIERFGWVSFLQAVGAEPRDERRNDVEATVESLMKADGMTLLVCACPSTARVYALEVPREIETCEQAQFWLRGGREINVVLAS